MPVYMQFAMMKIVWISCLGSMLWMNAASAPPGAPTGLFHDWNVMTVVALGSFTLKNWSTTYLLAILDSMLKNIGEASGSGDIRVAFGIAPRRICWLLAAV